MLRYSGATTNRAIQVKQEIPTQGGISRSTLGPPYQQPPSNNSTPNYASYYLATGILEATSIVASIGGGIFFTRTNQLNPKTDWQTILKLTENLSGGNKQEVLGDGVAGVSETE